MDPVTQGTLGAALPVAAAPRREAVVERNAFDEALLKRLADLDHPLGR